MTRKNYTESFGKNLLIKILSLKSSSYIYSISNHSPSTLKQFPDIGVNLKVVKGSDQI